MHTTGIPVPDLSDEIETAASEPASAESDGQKAQSHSLPDLIAADKHLASRDAMSRPGWGGIKISRARGSGAVE